MDMLMAVVLAAGLLGEVAVIGSGGGGVVCVIVSHCDSIQNLKSKI